MRKTKTLFEFNHKSYKIKNLKKPVVLLLGPTASGKTDLALNLYSEIPIEIISVDSVMVYKDFNLGSAKPSLEILKKYPHHLIDVLTPESIYTASDFVQDAIRLIEEAHQKGKLPILVGGSMMYFQSLLKGLDNLPTRNDNFREEMKAIKKSKGINVLFNELKLKDPDYANTLKENDSQRIIRALEIIHFSKKSLSSQLGRFSNNSSLDGYHVIQLGIFPKDRKLLHKRIEMRLEKIIDDGLVDETKKIIQTYNIKNDHPALKAINYKQALSFINNKYDNETLFLKALYATRQFAKRQVTWMRSWDNLELFDINEGQKILKIIKNTKEFQSFL